MTPRDANRLKTLLDGLSGTPASHWIGNDPVSFCRAYRSPRDREVAALVASCFAYGNVVQIGRTLEAVFSLFDGSPRRFVERFSPRKGKPLLPRFVHRFNDGSDLDALFWAISLMLDDAGSIEAFALKGLEPGDTDVGHLLVTLSDRIMGFDYAPVFGRRTIPRDAGFPFLFPSPAKGSACKRLCMFLRWVARPDDGVDLGCWKGLPPSKLVIPVDTHVRRIAGYLGLTKRTHADWRTALEITAALRALDPDDPVRYDFALAHLGISDGCAGSGGAACTACVLAGACTEAARG